VSWLLAAPVGFLLVFFVLPVAGLLERSLLTSHGVSLAAYGTALGDPTNLFVLGNTFRIAALVTLICVVGAYPVAYWLSGLPSRKANLYLVLVVVPYFTSVLVRTYAWLILLGTEGLVNRVLTGLHLVRTPLALLYNDFGVLIGMVYVLLPYMVLILYAVMRGIDRTLVRAAEVFGASPWHAFRRVFLPLSAPGIAGGCLLVFVIALGYFITPALMGGPRQTMIAMLIATDVNQLLNWGLASALAAVLLAATLVALYLYDRLLGLQSLIAGHR
jgi:putative spermidine/putrescine transport system permease protein